MKRNMRNFYHIREIMKDYLPILDEQNTKEFKKYVVDNMRK